MLADNQKNPGRQGILRIAEVPAPEVTAIAAATLPPLPYYDAACKALRDAAEIDEVKAIIDVAIATACYARQAKNRELQADAAEIRGRAEREGGLMWIKQKLLIGASTGAAGIGTSAGFLETRTLQPPTLSEVGIDKNLAQRMRKAAALSATEFEDAIKEIRANVTRESDRIINRTVNVAARNSVRSTTATPAVGLFNCIVIDPPWEVTKIERDVRPNQVGFEYPTMTYDEIADIDIPAADDAHLFCWTTHKHLPAALGIVGDAWRFCYVCLFTWHKTGGFQPYGLPQFNSEFVIYARQGAPKFLTTKQLFTCFEGPRREHSRKPDAFYETLRRVTAEPRLDMFAREKRDGFAQYGNEPTKFDAAE